MQVRAHFYMISRRKGTGEGQCVLRSKRLRLGYVMGSTMTNEYPTNDQLITNDWTIGGADLSRFGRSSNRFYVKKMT